MCVVDNYLPRQEGRQEEVARGVGRLTIEIYEDLDKTRLICLF